MILFGKGNCKDDEDLTYRMNLTLEILQKLDTKYHESNTQYWSIPVAYYEITEIIEALPHYITSEADKITNLTHQQKKKESS